MKTKKIGVFAALTVVLLVLAALIASCVDALGPDVLAVVQKDRKTYIPPRAGYMGFNIEVEANGARFTTPDKTEFNDISKFARREVYIFGPGGTFGINGFETDGTTLKNWNGITAVSCVEDDDPYTVQVIGYNSAGVAVAFGEDVAVTVTSTGGEATIIMKEIETGNHSTVNPGNGILAFNLNNGEGFTTVNANVFGLSSGTTNDYSTGTHNAIPTGDPLTFSLAPGYYRLQLVASKTGLQTVTYSELVLIESGFTATYAKTLASVSNVHKVTYNFNDDRTTTTLDVDFNHGTQLTTHNGTTAGTNPQYLDGSTPDTNRTFKGWFTDPSAGTQLTIGSYLVLRPIEIFAQWLGTTVQINISVSFKSDPGLKALSFTVTDNDNSDAVINDTDWEFDQNNPPDIKITVALDDPSGGTVTYNWSYNLGTLTGPVNTDSIDVDFGISNGGASFTLIATHVFTVTGYDPGDTDGDGAGSFEGTVEIVMTAP